MVGLKEDGYAPGGFENVDFYNTLAIDPFGTKIESIAMLRDLRNIAARKLHADRLNGVPPPPSTSLADVNSLITHLKDATPFIQTKVLENLNNRARNGWVSTWSVSDTPGQWKPIQSYATRPLRTADRDINSDDDDNDNDFLTPKRPRSTPYAGSSTGSRYDSGRKRTHDKSPSERANASKRQRTNGDGSSKSSPINLTDDVIEISGDDSDDSDDDSPRQPLYEVARWKSEGKPASDVFRYKLTRADVQVINNELKRRSKTAGAIMAIGVVRRQADKYKGRYPEYVVSASMVKKGSKVSYRVWSLDIMVKDIEKSWGKMSKRSSISRGDVYSTGYHFLRYGGDSEEAIRKHLEARLA
jgi:hypothetical protein